MSRPGRSSRWRSLGHLLARTVQAPWVGLLNLRRRLRKSRWPDYVVVEITGELPERVPSPPWYLGILPFVPRPRTLESLARDLRQIAQDPDVQGLVLVMRNTRLSLARAQSLATLVRRFREWSTAGRPGRSPKSVVVYLEECTNTTYTVAAAGDRIYLAPLTEWNVLGLRAEPVFLAETLRRLGLAADVVRVAPWKSAADALAHSEISPAHREQLEWLLDSWYSQLLQHLVLHRALDEPQIRALIDQAPLDARRAAEAGLVDGVAYEDELPRLLGSQERPARLMPLDQARRYLRRRLGPRVHTEIGVLSLRGSIVTGTSREFPFELPVLGEGTIGSATVQQQIRAVRENPRLRALVIHVDSPGGSALASDQIAREIQLLAQEKPVVVYMGDVAASGGYYISLPAAHIVAQPATLTGSIGVIVAKIVNEGAYARVQARRYTFKRGQHADLYASTQPWSRDQRQAVAAQVDQIYRAFKGWVVRSRGLDEERLEALAGGRVWTGTQALEHGLIDELGDFHTAVEAACRRLGVPADEGVRLVSVQVDRPRTARPPQGVESLFQGLQFLLQEEWERHLLRERFWLLADGLPRLRG